jgi:predicted membrane metal-binding protein
MTSSETQTEASPGAGAGPLDRLAGRLDRVIFGGALVLGFAAILYVNGWRFGPPVFVLFTGWLGILISAHFLWKTAMVAATEGEGEDDEGFEVASTRRDDLLRDKRAVLKAIKEIEFDHAMDKMSQRDADELLAIYRRRAIAIIKELEGGEAGSVSELIDREVKARLAVDSAARGAQGKAEKARKKRKASGAAKAGEPEGERAAEDAAGDDAGEPLDSAGGAPRDEDEGDDEVPARSAEAVGGRSGA